MLKVSCSLYGRKLLTSHIYHYNSYDYGGFNLCQTCYDRGMHCYDDEHMLVELGKIGSWTVPRRYHSCVKYSAGERDIIDL